MGKLKMKKIDGQVERREVGEKIAKEIMTQIHPGTVNVHKDLYIHLCI